MALEFNKIPDGVYLISPEFILNINTFVQDLDFIFSHSIIRIFQLRLKNQSSHEVAAIIKEVCDRHNVLFVLNDDAQFALQNKYALHIGKTDGDISAINLPIIGVSCYNNVTRALQMAEYGASYVSFGAFFNSKTKPNAIPCDISVLQNFKKQNNTIKVSVIGGINSANFKPLVDAGANFICISNAVWGLKSNLQRIEEIKMISKF